MLNREEIKSLIDKDGLLSGYIDLDTQLAPNGFDLTAAKVFSFSGAGAIDFSNKERQLCSYREEDPVKSAAGDKFGWWHLKRGAYKVLTNEAVKLPNNLSALGLSRSSLLRVGAFIQTAVWDAGFSGKSEFVLVVENTDGLRLKENARVAQLVFFPMTHTKEGYSGIYKDKF